MVRWILTLLVAPTPAALVLRLTDEPTLPVFLLFLVTLIAFCGAIWYGLGVLLDSREVVRLLSFDRKSNLVTLRFNSLLALQRARQVVVEP